MRGNRRNYSQISVNNSIDQYTDMIAVTVVVFVMYLGVTHNILCLGITLL